MTITSADNSKIVQTTKLLDKKYRKAMGLYIVEGERLLLDAVKYGAKIRDVFVAESCAEKYNFDGQIVVADKIFAKMCDTVNTQGVLAVVEKPNTTCKAPTGNCLILDGLQDPGNVGTLIRTAAACGFTDVFAVNCVDVYSPKVLRAAMSAHFCVNIATFDSLQQAFELCNCQIIAADMRGENVFSAHFENNVALVLGNEGNGLSDMSRQRADLTVALPMRNGFESLNVAVAGSVIMYQIFCGRGLK